MTWTVGQGVDFTLEHRERATKQDRSQLLEVARFFGSGKLLDNIATADVDRFVKGESFNGDESLVVVHADVGIDIPASGFGESGVGWEGTGQVATLVPHLLDGRQDDFFFLTVSEQPVFPRVWIETTDGDTRLFAK